MPARITVYANESELADQFGLPRDATTARSLQPRYNAAPSQLIPVIRIVNGVRELAHLKWGLIPHWTGRPLSDPPVNARSETVADKPSFRSAFQSRRCLVPANGFYGWRAGETRKQPYYFTPTAGGLFACAGIWDRWAGPKGLVETVAVLTMPSNERVMPTDPRMPVVVDEEHFAAWLDPNTKEPAELLACFAPYPAARMDCWPVSTRVNSPVADDPELIVPILDPSQPVRKSPTVFGEV